MNSSLCSITQVSFQAIGCFPLQPKVLPMCPVYSVTHVPGSDHLLMSIERLSALTQEQRNQLSVFDAMTKNPLWVTLDDSPLLVAEMMRERSLKRLPVVYAIDDLRIAGQVRLEVLMALVIRGVDETSSLS